MGARLSRCRPVRQISPATRTGMDEAVVTDIRSNRMSTAVAPSSLRLDHLEWLEAEAIYILREVAAQSAKPVLLFSGGKDSCVVLRLAEKAFRPGPFPFPLLHIDTGHNFQEVLEFRDERVATLNEKLIVRSVEDSIARGTVKLRDELDSRNAAQ